MTHLNNHEIAYAVRIIDPEKIERIRQATSPDQINRPLRDEMFRIGFEWKSTKTHEHFVDSDGEYVPYPLGYIRGAHLSENGSPRPWSFSVQGHDGWHQRSFPTLSRDAYDWALETAKEIILDTKDKGDDA